MISPRDRLDDLLGFRGIERIGSIELSLVIARHVAVEVATAFTAKLEFARSCHFEAAFARFMGLHLRHESSAKSGNTPESKAQAWSVKLGLGRGTGKGSHRFRLKLR